MYLLKTWGRSQLKNTNNMKSSSRDLQLHKIISHNIYKKIIIWLRIELHIMII